MDFHRIPWNCSCQRNWRILSSMEFHGISRVSEIGALQVPWNSMELLESSKLAHPKFHGIPWNCSCHRNWRTTSSMEFHRIPWNFSCQRNWHILSSMEFHGTFRVSQIGALQIPWNSMEMLESSKLAHPKFHGIPWNCSCHRNWRTTSSMEFHGTSRVSEMGAF